MKRKLSHGCLAFHRPLKSCQTRLICFYGSGQTAVNLRHLEFPKGVERCIVELPGRGFRASEPLCDSLVGVATEAAEKLADFLKDGGRFDVFAYSLGCALAYEFIRALKRLADVEPTIFFLAVRRPPGQPIAPFVMPDGSSVPVEEVLGGDDEKLMRVVAQYYKNPQLAQMVEQCADSESADTAEARKYLYEQLAPVVRNDMTLGASVAEAYWDPMTEDDRELNCAIVAFAASTATDIDSGEAAVKGWKDVTSAKFELHNIEATHEGILRDPEFMRIVHNHLNTSIDSIFNKTS